MRFRDFLPASDDVVLGRRFPPLPRPLYRLTPQDQRYHATIWGRTGSGKSRLLQSLFRWLLPQLDVAHVEWALAGWMATTRAQQDQEPVALDGMTVRGAGTGKGEQPELISVTTHQTHETLLQVRIPHGTNEIPVAQDLLGWVGLQDRIITADAQHAQTEFAQRVLDGGGHSVLCLKEHWPALHAGVATSVADPASLTLAGRLAVYPTHRVWVSSRLPWWHIPLRHDAQTLPPVPLTPVVSRSRLDPPSLVPHCSTLDKDPTHDNCGTLREADEWLQHPDGQSRTLLQLLLRPH